MSDVDSHFRKLLKKKYFKRSENLFESDSEWMDSIRPYMGNPFLQPGSLGARSQQWPKVILADEKLDILIKDNRSEANEEHKEECTLHEILEAPRTINSTDHVMNTPLPLKNDQVNEV